METISRCAEETMNKKVQSDFLFAQPSFASGAARVLDLWGQFDDYNRSETPAEADAKAIAADWLLVGQDILDSIEYHESEAKVA
jgi:hypothetical protein